MDRTMIKTTFIREFATINEAETFARRSGGEVSVRYDYDDFLQSIIVIYRVRY